MHTLLLCLVDIRYAARIAPVKENFTEIIKAVLDAASFIDSHMKKKRLGEENHCALLPNLTLFLERFNSAQFRTTLDNFKSQFSRLRENYKDVMLTQIVVVVDELKNISSILLVLTVLSVCLLTASCFSIKRRRKTPPRTLEPA
jgi:hypothetical protein